MSFKTLKRFIPYLDIWIDFGFLGIRTELMHYCMCEAVKVYICLDIKFLKYRFKIRLYSPDFR
jgi:hypothetical protein